MTVCSERHKEYSIRTGADPNTITATGQPRFDFYARPPQRPAGRTILFLSYHLGRSNRRRACDLGSSSCRGRPIRGS